MIHILPNEASTQHISDLLSGEVYGPIVDRFSQNVKTLTASAVSQ